MNVVYRVLRNRTIVAAGLIFAAALGIAGSVISLAWRIEVVPTQLNRPTQLVIVRSEEGEQIRNTFRFDEFRAIASSGVLSQTAAIGYEYAPIQTGDLSRYVPLAFVSQDYFRSIGVTLHRGRGFSAFDFMDGADPTAILSYSYWRDQLGAPKDVIGHEVLVGRTVTKIIGIAPPAVPATRLDVAPAAFLPIQFVSAILNNPGFLYNSMSLQLNVTPVQWLTVMGRLKPTNTIRKTQDDLRSTISMDQVVVESLRVVPLADAIAPVTVIAQLVGLSRMLLLLAVAFLVLGTTALSMVVMLRAETHRGEFHVRRALGATRLRIALMVGTDVGITVLLAVIIALPLTAGLQRIAADILLPGGASIGQLELSLNWPTIAAVTLLGVAAGLLVLLISWGAVAACLRAPISGPNLSLSGISGMRFRRGVIVVLTSLVITLLGGAVFSVRAFSRIVSIDLGYPADRVLNVTLDFGDYKYTPAEIEQFLEGLNRSVVLSPAVRWSGVMRKLGGLRTDGSLILRDQRITVPQYVQFLGVDLNYFQATGLPIISGRAFGQYDSLGQPRVALVSSSLARRMAEDGDVVGQSVYLPTGFVTVVGVTADRVYDLESRSTMTLYVPGSQHRIVIGPGGRPLGTVGLMLDVEEGREAKRVILNAIRGLDSRIAPRSMATAEEEIEAAFAFQHLVGTVMTVFAAVGTLLLLLTLSALARSVASIKRKELAIRSALGASPRSIVQWCTKEVAKPFVFGLLFGLVGLRWWYQVMASSIVGLRSDDLIIVIISLASVIVVSNIIAVTSSFIEIRRVDSYQLLKQD